MRRRGRAAALDAVIAAVEHHDFRSNHPEVLRLEHEYLVEMGLLDPDEPTRWSYYSYQQHMRAEFSPAERAIMRAALGLVPESPVSVEGEGEV